MKHTEYTFNFKGGPITVWALGYEEAEILAKAEAIKRGWDYEIIKPNMKLLQRLAEIEQEDEDRCAGCGGEDCICCEYYHDRQRWKSPEELFMEEAK